MNLEQENSKKITKVLILLINIGSPKDASMGAVRDYLADVWSDNKVIWLPSILRQFLLNVFVLPFKSNKLASSYRKILLPEGEPLLLNTKKQAQKLLSKLLALKLNESRNLDIMVSFAMRYGNPSIQSELLKAKQAGIEQIIVLPLYPQYSLMTTASALDKITDSLQILNYAAQGSFIEAYYAHPLYIKALVSNIKNCLEKNNDTIEHLVFSFHGLSKKHVKTGAIYLSQCQNTIELIVNNLQLKTSFYTLSFQSHLGFSSHLLPNTSSVLQELPVRGIKNVAVIAPGFSVDCLATLDEINGSNRELFYRYGGKKFYYIPALNDAPLHLELLQQLVLEKL